MHGEELITSSTQVLLPFCLVCCECDAGLEISTPEQAIAEGWTEIVEDNAGSWWNYIGYCRECWARVNR